MAGEYSEQDLARVATLGPRVNADVPGSEAALMYYGLVATRAAEDCAKKFGWNEERTTKARKYELVRLKSVAFREHGPLDDAGLRRIEAASSGRDRDGFWAMMERVATGDYSGASRQAMEHADRAIEHFIRSAGFPPDRERDVAIVDYLSTLALERKRARDFAASAVD